MNAVRTTAANGFSDQDPNDVMTAVDTGSTSRPETTAAGSSCASPTANAFRITSAPTLSSAIQIARGTCRVAPFVSSEAPTQASKPMKTQPPTARAASIPAPTDPPESDSAPSVVVRIETSCERNASRSARPIPTDATISAAIPARTTRPSTVTPNAPATAHTSTRIIPMTTIRFGVGSIPASASAHGAPRYATVVFATAYAQIATQPLSQPYAPPSSRRLHWYAPPATGNSDASSA